MSIELIAGLIGSQLVRAVASEVATTLACQAIQHAVGTMARPATSAAATTPGVPSTAPYDANVGAVTVSTGTPELRALSSVEVLSAVPGRARLRVQGLRDDAERAQAVVGAVLALDGVGKAEANPLTGTMLVHFDAGVTSVDRIVAALEPRPAAPRPLRAAERAPYLRLVVG
ncbi:MAG: hypothetical protein U0893_25775 [Chloroflexota bacterium]